MRLLHRYAGIIAGAGLIYLLLTGLPLQFTTELALGSRFVQSPLILDAYNLDAPATVRFDNGVAHLGGRLYTQTGEIGPAREFLGAVRYQGLLVIATAQKVLLLSTAEPASTTDPLTESLDFSSRLTGIAMHDGRILVNSRDGVLSMDEALLNVSESTTQGATVDWRAPVQLDESQAAPYRQLHRERMLTVERLLQDLHSGRAFGPAGVWVINLATVLLAALAVTGYLIWWRSRDR
jgi:hypothetical protein